MGLLSLLRTRTRIPLVILYPESHQAGWTASDILGSRHTSAPAPREPGSRSRQGWAVHRGTAPSLDTLRMLYQQYLAHGERRRPHATFKVEA
jgi:hypothetical protein